jgi:multiple sugar transport system substrate-binding protein
MSFQRFVLSAGAAVAVTSALVGSALAADAPAKSMRHGDTRTHKKAAASAPAFKPVPSNQDVTLNLVTYLPLISSGANTTLNSLISGFEAAHPNIKVVPQTASAATGAGVTATVQQDEAAGNTPDVIQTGMDMVNYLATGGLGGQDLNKIVGDQQLAAEWGGKYPYPRALQVLGQVNGDQYSIPWTLSTPVLFYNATLFQKAGLNPKDPPKTWAQVEQDAATIKKATGAAGISDCAAGGGSAVDWCTQSMIRSDGGNVLSFNGKQLTWTEPQTVAAVQELGALGSSGAMVNISAAQSVQEFGSGQLAMVLNSSAEQSALLSAIQGHGTMLDAPVPGFGKMPAIPTNSGSGLSILSKSSLQQRAAWELIKYFTSPAAYTQITENIGYAPLRVSLANAPQYLESWAHDQNLVEANLQQLKVLAPWEDYPGPNFGQIEQLLENAVSAVAFQGQSAKSALAAAQQQADGLLK